ncbi:helix-turn-helix domain-containing protein [Alkalihalobacterium alkalinitrilicum]|uniref:helix-turn-helix domain-containing protein n=1 Tax=Alkalihalobacterium alkalinitrilicum TaxID=427920 RepID=UPI000994F5D0|nr:helix-turn-helix domain-containing protein [Alkalihalobacterium alkalinitrilicum]
MGQIKQSDKVNKLFEINHLLTTSLDIGVVLRTLVEEARNLLEVSDTVILYLYDREDNVLRVAEGVGIDIEVMRQIAFVPGESLTGKAYAERKSYLFAEEDILKQNMANMSPENYQAYFEGVYRRHIKSAFSVPLLYQDECLGVLIVDNFENDGQFTDDDIRIIEIIANQSAIAIVHSNLFEDLKKKNDQLMQSIDIHEKFTKAILDGGGIDTILALLSRILAVQVKFQDENLESTSTEYPIIRGRETLGSIYIGKDINTLSPLEVVAVEHASTALALELVKINALYEKELHFREEVFQQMIEGISYGEFKRVQNYVNWNSDSELVCVVLEGKHNPLWKSDSLLDKEKFIRSLENICQNISNSTFILSRTYQAILIIPVTSEKVVDLIVHKISDQWKKQKDMIFGMGRKVTVGKLGDSYREALDAVRFGKTSGDRFVDYSNLGFERLLQNVDPSTLSLFVDDKMGPLLSMEPIYIETLGVFIRLNKNHKRTAEHLHVHPNTLYQRIKKMERLMNISFDREVDWINLMIAYNLYVTSHNA